MTADEVLQRRDVDALMRLLGEIHALLSDTGARKSHTLRGLRALFQAPVALHSRGNGRLLDLRDNDVVHDGLTPRQQTVLNDTENDGLPADPTVAMIDKLCRGRKCGEVLAISRRDLMADDAWYAHPHVKQVRKRLGLDGFACAIEIGSGPGTRNVVAVFRRWEEPAFDHHATQLLELFWRHAAPLLTTPDGRAPVDDGQLPARLGEVLAYLHAGRSTKEIARLLDLSPHTVYDHIKRLHKRFNANSRTELIAATQHLRDELAQHTKKR
jgi:DNA-binding CsgD family transcriptional regulator